MLPRLPRRVPTRLLVACTASALVLASTVITSPAVAAAPANDDFSNAVTLTSGSDTAIDLTEATQELGEVDGGCQLLDPTSGTTWYKFAAPANTALDAYDTAATSTSGVSVDFVVGTGANDINALTCDFSPLPSSTDVQGYGARYVTDEAVTVYLRVSSYGSAAGSLHFEAYDATTLRPENDDVANASPLPVKTTFEVDTQFATSQSAIDGPSGSCEGAKTTWYSYDATASGVLSVGDEQPSGNDTLQVAAFTAPPAPAVRVCQPFNGSISPALGAGLRLRVEAGSSYLIRFAAGASKKGSFRAVFTAGKALPGDTDPVGIGDTGTKSIPMQLATSDLRLPGYAYTAYYRWKAPRSGAFRFSTRNSPKARDTLLVVFDSAWEYLAGNDDEGTPEDPGDLRALLDFSATKGKTYYVAVAEYGFVAGNVGPALLGWGPKPTKIAPTVKPKVTGQAKVGKTLSGKTGSWNPPDVTLETAWLANGKVIKGANGAKLKLTRALKGKKITFRVTASYPDKLLRTTTVKVDVGKVS